MHGNSTFSFFKSSTTVLYQYALNAVVVFVVVLLVSLLARPEEGLLSLVDWSGEPLHFFLFARGSAAVAI